MGSRVRVTLADPAIEETPDEVIQRIATACKNNGITNDAGWTAFVDANHDVAAINAATTIAQLRAEVVKMAAFGREFYGRRYKIG